MMNYPPGGVPAYIDLTGGLPPSMWGMYLAALLSALAAGLAFLKTFGHTIWYFLKRHVRLLGVLALFLVGIIMVLWFTQRQGTPAGGAKVLVLGLDGLDPR